MKDFLEELQEEREERNRMEMSALFGDGDDEEDIDEYCRKQVTLQEAMNGDLASQLIKNCRGLYIYRNESEPTWGELFEMVEGVIAKEMNNMIQKGVC